jgi:signal transduction histidine kinase
MGDDPEHAPVDDLDRAQLIQRERQSTARLRVLAEASRVFSVAGADMSTVLEAIANQVLSSLGSSCSIALATADGEWLEAVLVRDLAPDREVRLRALASKTRVPLGQGISGRVLAAGESLLIPVLAPGELGERTVAALSSELERLAPSSLLMCPLMTSGRRLGTISTTRYPGEAPFTDDDRVLLEDLGDRAALAIENARLYQIEREARARAEQTDRRKEEFMATLSHELRNPLAAIRMGVQVMRELPLDDPGVVWAREMIARHLEQLSSLVGDLSDVSRINLGKFDLSMEMVDLASIASVALESSRPMLTQRGHNVTIELPATSVWVRGDTVRLIQVISNLLDNAGKYTDSGGQLGLSVSRTGGQATVTVRDNGIGIPPEMLDRVFDPFLQLEGCVERSAGGLGIGLTLVKRLVDMHGGSVEAASEGTGRGSRFTLRLPAYPVSDHSDPASAG